MDKSLSCVIALQVFPGLESGIRVQVSRILDKSHRGGRNSQPAGNRAIVAGVDSTGRILQHAGFLNLPRRDVQMEIQTGELSGRHVKAR